MNLNDLFKKAGEADIDVTKAPSFEEFQPQKGEKYKVKVEEAKNVLSKNGNPGVSFLLRIVDGPDGINRTIFQNFYFSENTHANVIARNLHYCELLGASQAAITSADTPASTGWKDGTDIAVEDVIVGLEPGYRKDKNDPNKEWPNHHFTAVEGGASGRVVVEDDDAELSWDD